MLLPTSYHYRYSLAQSQPCGLPWVFSDSSLISFPVEELKTCMMNLESESNEVSGAVCARCTSMTATLDGLRMLASEDGFEHYDDAELHKSIELGCPLCFFLRHQLEKSPVLYRPIRVVAYTEEVVVDAPHTDINHPFRSKRILSLCVADDSLKRPWIEVYSSLDDGATAYLPVLPERISVHSPEIVEMIKHRLKTCQEQHHECAVQERPILPRRVIDVGTVNHPASPRVFINHDQMKEDYTCLSYCWGGPQDVALTTSTLEQFSKRLPLEFLPQTIKDAITVTRSLAIRFLWVDALCILQDDNDDKSIEIGAMGSIYKNATVTIAAASGRKVTEGILEDRPIPKAYRLPFYVSAGHLGSIWLRTLEYYITREVDPLESRGWALQESLLSRRMLYYGSLDLMWRCQKERFVPVNSSHDLYLEESREGLPKSIFNIQEVEDENGIETRSNIWEEVVDTFAGRELTLFEDRLPALAGIVSELQYIWRDTYLAGMWKSFLIRQLGWVRDEYMLKDVSPAPYRSPGWSWASSRGSVLFNYIDQEDAELVTCTVIPVDIGSPFGRVKSGRLILSGALIPVPPSVNHGDVIMDLGPNGSRIVDQNSRLLLLGYGYLKSAVCLIITPVGDGTYIRIGVAYMIARKTEVWRAPDLKREIVTII